MLLTDEIEGLWAAGVRDRAQTVLLMLVLPRARKLHDVLYDDAIFRRLLIYDVSYIPADAKSFPFLQILRECRLHVVAV